jgi:hypothetical protein
MPNGENRVPLDLGSRAEPNLMCQKCKQAFYSESAASMNGRPCSVDGCDGTLAAGATAKLESAG